MIDHCRETAMNKKKPYIPIGVKRTSNFTKDANENKARYKKVRVRHNSLGNEKLVVLLFNNDSKRMTQQISFSLQM